MGGSASKQNERKEAERNYTSRWDNRSDISTKGYDHLQNLFAFNFIKNGLRPRYQSSAWDGVVFPLQMLSQWSGIGEKYLAVNSRPGPKTPWNPLGSGC